MYNHLQGNMDPELELTTTALLQKVTDRLFQKDVDAALESMVWNCTPTCTMKALLAGGQRHLSDAVRRCTAQHLASLVERVGPAHLLLDTKDTAELILPAVTRLAQDSSQATRHFGQQMLMSLASHAEFEEMVHKYVPAKGIPQLRTISHKPELDKSQSSSSSVSKSKRALSGVGVTQGLTQQAKSHSIAEREKYIKAMKAQMGSNDFRMRLRAIDKIAADCAEKPDLVAACKFPIFDAIAARLQESNRKINQHTLEALQSMIPLLKDCLGQVLNILLPVIVENHLNSKIDDMHRAAVVALDSLIFHLDNTLLLGIMCNRAQVLGGKAKGHLIEKVADIVRAVYQRKPQTVEQTVLPLLWKLLASSSYREHTTTLCMALYTHMGQWLRESAVNQPMTIISALNQMLRTF
ncbi:hypothetical protein SKAU_G00249050 [Synaphobranchus kaupii]|uniref:TOG domain-containing protein n=1 Tax=Synaphobranchus kaupii TaxID=118154 RepID=A0A9Q1IRP0_SYNKA|nr:hypothetical protein SKAU_G00249050 [Synaphobranchus kaupii]